ncbi:unnamed protein product [Paramecium sonneborni]|uniref:Uncharacterized protein n=1 Tax=Paramecium sonneborni TaxID=65129 RepID=A0A8S1Q2W9_9CILI|nr:unnamed protein product [Paramecium sonneborni]
MVEYPKISEILADTGSIISWILSISFIVSKYNENICLQKTQKEVIQMYYNDFIDFKIKKNLLGKIKSVNYKEKEYDPQKSEEILQKLDQIVIEKMNYLNLQNEVAKLQQILQEHLGLEKIKKYLESKSKLELLFDKLGVPEKKIQSVNQILPTDQQCMRASQLQVNSETETFQQMQNTLDQELEERIELLANKNIRQIQKQGPQNLQQSLNINLQVINLEQSQLSSLK